MRAELFTQAILAATLLTASLADNPSLRLPLKPLFPVSSTPSTQTLHPISLKPINPGKLHIVIPKTGKIASPEGPDLAKRLDLVDIVEDEATLAALDTVVGWDIHRIVQDKKAPNYFYYVPSRFLLEYDEEGYGLYVQYNSSEKEGDASVLITAHLAAPYKTGDISLLKAMLRHTMGLTDKVPLKIRAIQPTDVELDVETLSTGLSIPKERIAVQLPGSLRDTMTLTMRLTPDETEEVLALLSGAGLSGNVVVKVQEGSLTIPFHLTYTEFAGDPIPEISEWAKGKSIAKVTNVTPFPVTLRSIDAYVNTPKGPALVSKALKRTSAIAPHKARPFKLPSARELFGRQPLMAWFDMRLETECEPCLKKIDEEVRSGIALNPLENLSFEAIPSVFEKYGIYKIRLKVKTPYFTKKANKIAIKEIELTKEHHRDETLRIYMPPIKEGSEPLLFKYKITLVLESGEMVEGGWHKWRDTALYLGSKQLEALVKKE